MSAGELLEIEPAELKFPFELRKQISCSLQLSNRTDDHIAFKVKTTNPKKYCVRPNNGVVLPRSTCDVVVTMQAQREPPADIQCKDKFLVQSAVVEPGILAKDITAEMFSRESGNKVDEVKLRVVYVSPPQPPSPVHEGSDEGSSPRASVSENSNVDTSEPAVQTRAYVTNQEENYPEFLLSLNLESRLFASGCQDPSLRFPGGDICIPVRLGLSFLPPLLFFSFGRSILSLFLPQPNPPFAVFTAADPTTSTFPSSNPYTSLPLDPSPWPTLCPCCLHSRRPPKPWNSRFFDLKIRPSLPPLLSPQPKPPLYPKIHHITLPRPRFTEIRDYPTLHVNSSACRKFRHHIPYPFPSLD